MTEYFIAYKGQKYTPLEFSEKISDELPIKAREHLGTIARTLEQYALNIKLADKNMEGYKKLIEKDPNEKSRELYKKWLQEQIEGREKQVEWFKRDLNHFYLVLATLPLSEELSKIVKREVDSLK